MKLKYIIISSGLFFTMILTGIGLNCLEKPNQENYMQEVSNENIICDGQTKNVEYHTEIWGFTLTVKKSCKSG